MGTDKVPAECTAPKPCKWVAAGHGVARGTAEPGAAALGEAALPPAAAVHAPKLNGIIHLLWLQKGICWKSCEACPGPAATLLPGTDRRDVNRRCSLCLGTLRDCPQEGSGAQWGCGAAPQCPVPKPEG